MHAIVLKEEHLACTEWSPFSYTIWSATLSAEALANTNKKIYLKAQGGKKSIKMMKRQKTHSELASNVKKKIHHLHQPRL